MKLPNGYGSVYKQPGNRRRPWVARVTIGWTEEGKQQYYFVGYYKTRAEAINGLAEYHKNPIGLQGDMTVAEVWEQWRTTSAYTKLGASTKRGYDAAWTHLSALGTMPIKDVRKSHLQDLIDKMSTRVGYASCHKVKVLAGILMKHALADNIVDQNYAEFVVLPEKNTREATVFSDLEIQSIAKLAETDTWANTVLILIYTGMRISELTGLTKFNVDIEHRLITGGIKTDAGKNRIVPISSKIFGYVAEWYNQPGEYLIQRDGKRISSDYYRKYLYYPALERAGVRKIRPHDARHTFGTLLDRAKVNTKHIQELMGHTDYSTTANIYTHPEIDELRKAVERL